MAWLDDYLAGLRAKYPDYVILMYQNDWYHVYDQDADVMHRILDWDVYTVNGHRVTGGHRSGRIRNALRDNRYAYKVIHGERIIETYDPPTSKAVVHLPKNIVRSGSRVTKDVDISKYDYGVKVGDTVYHKNKFGRGEIKSIDGRYITVNFGTEEKKFVFPDVFLQKYLGASGFVIPPNAKNAIRLYQKQKHH